MIKFAPYVSALAAVQLAACSPGAENSTDDGRPVENVAAAQQAEPRAPQSQEKLILALGDSLYAGYGLDRSQSFPAVLERTLDAQGIPSKVVNAGVSGDTSAGGLRRLVFTLDGLERTPDLAIVGLGGNDVLRGLDPAETRRNLEAILAELSKRNIPIYITGMMAPRNLGGPYVRQFEAIYPELARKYDAGIDPFFLAGAISQRGMMLPDGIHPSAAGIETITKRVAPAIAARLDNAKPRPEAS